MGFSWVLPGSAYIAVSMNSDNLILSDSNSSSQDPELSDSESPRSSSSEGRGTGLNSRAEESQRTESAGHLLATQAAFSAAGEPKLCTSVHGTHLASEPESKPRTKLSANKDKQTAQPLTMGIFKIRAERLQLALMRRAGLDAMPVFITTQASTCSPVQVTIFRLFREQVVERGAVDHDIAHRRKELGVREEGDVVVRMVNHC